MIRAISWEGDRAQGAVVMIDQRRLPVEEVYIRHAHMEEVAASIRDMVIRGAPAIGVAAAMGFVLAARAVTSPDLWPQALNHARDVLAATRPTAVNLFWALDRMRRCAATLHDLPLPARVDALLHEALAIQAQDIATNEAIGAHGADAMLARCGDKPLRVLTHCNTGSLATAGIGTALGVLRVLHRRNRLAHIWVDETRPYLQGARLTAWECLKDDLPCALISDNMAGFFMQRGDVDAVIVGADRVAANGDTANKIGTYSLAVLCHYHNIPFYIAAPINTLDLNTPNGDAIPIEERPASEVTHLGTHPIAPPTVPARHPAFDVTPAALITGIITERGVAAPPYQDTLRHNLSAQGAVVSAMTSA
jgi:methylthioribose-1-phosphate isomerase